MSEFLEVHAIVLYGKGILNVFDNSEPYCACYDYDKYFEYCAVILTFVLQNCPMIKEKDKVLDEQNFLSASGRELVLFNDDENTFDFVINTLIEVCGHEPVQAEQCTLTAHYKGKCGVKSGDTEVLQPYCTEMLKRGLSVEIQ